MQFGWLTLALSPSGDEDAARLHQQIEQVCYAENLGFSDVWLTEHYFTGESVYNDAVVFAAALAMRTERIRIGFAVVQMPFHHPVRLATQLALLDNLSKGRIDVGVGKGTIYNEYEFVGHGLRSDDSRERMEEAIQDAGTAAPPLSTARPALMAQCHFAEFVHGMRPQGYPHIDRAAGRRQHQGALGDLCGGPRRGWP